MDTERFDDLVRSLTVAPSRRTVLGLALGGVLGSLLGPADAAAKKKRKKKKKKGCRAECCADADCGAGQMCAQGRCVTGQGTCATGADICLDGRSLCGTEGECFCETTREENQTRCGAAGAPFTECDTCASDADCATLVPDVPGIFCIKGGPACICGGRCRAPCPSTGCFADADCGAGQLCAQGQCVTGQGTCAAGANSCDSTDIHCNGSTACKCFPSAAGGTRCGEIPIGIACGQCDTDEDCVVFGFGPGVFCVTETAPGTNCSCGAAGQGFCIIPCSSAEMRHQARHGATKSAPRRRSAMDEQRFDNLARGLAGAG